MGGGKGRKRLMYLGDRSTPFSTRCFWRGRSRRRVSRLSWRGWSIWTSWSEGVRYVDGGPGWGDLIGVGEWWGGCGETWAMDWCWFGGLLVDYAMCKG